MRCGVCDPCCFRLGVCLHDSFFFRIALPAECKTSFLSFLLYFLVCALKVLFFIQTSPFNIGLNKRQLDSNIGQLQKCMLQMVKEINQG